MKILKKLFFKHFVYTSSNLKKVLLILIVNVIGISTIIGIPVVVILDLAFIYYNIDRVFKDQGGAKFIFKIANFLWIFFILIAVLYILYAMFF